MFNYEDFYKLYNCKSEARYQELKEQLNEMLRQMTAIKERGFREKIFWYTKTNGEYLLLLTRLEEKWTPDYRNTASLNEFKQDQELLFGDVKAEKYDKSYANPRYMVSLVGKEVGPVLAAISKMFKEAVQDAYCHRRFLMADWIQFYFDLQKYLLHGQVRVAQLRELVQGFRLQQAAVREALYFHQRYNVSNAALTDMVEQENLDQPYYLYQLGVPVSEQEESLQRFFAALPQEKIDSLATAVVSGFKKSFIRNNKDIHKKSTVALSYAVGMERLIKHIMRQCRQELGMEPFITNVMSAAVNKQYEYDHRFDAALYLNEQYVQSQKEAIKQIVEENAGLLQGYGGIMVIEGFGEKLFVPQICEEALRFTQLQTKLVEEIRQYEEQEEYRIGRLEESSYTMMALPVPQIGERFKEIFDEMIKINTLEEEYVAKAQHALINALDRGSAVHIVGSDENETDICISLQPLLNPRKQTNFLNCLADVNLPVGEVFTSPRLKGTSGVLHVEKAHLEGLCYENLKLTFEDGYITDYTCSNFEDLQQGRDYIYENLLYPHESLPMGEFAIGTNTLAYCMAQKYDILEKLPTLIVEKLGPHFAIGDTCFSYEEEIPVYNVLDRKEMVARDNECSILRKTEPEKAYTQAHIDITLPYEQIGRISVVKADGSEMDLIRGGRFVLIGTDMLNVPLMAMENELGGEFYGRI